MRRCSTTARRCRRGSGSSIRTSRCGSPGSSRRAVCAPQITRLGQGVDRDRKLHPDAIERGLATLREYRTVMDDLGVERVRATATSAARDASNRDEFFVPVASVIGVEPELLTGEAEARLE